MASIPTEIQLETEQALNAAVAICDKYASLEMNVEKAKREAITEIAKLNQYSIEGGPPPANLDELLREKGGPAEIEIENVTAKIRVQITVQDAEKVIYHLQDNLIGQKWGVAPTNGYDVREVGGFKNRLTLSRYAYFSEWGWYISVSGHHYL
jgi:hypothetical protein